MNGPSVLVIRTGRVMATIRTRMPAARCAAGGGQEYAFCCIRHQRYSGHGVVQVQISGGQQTIRRVGHHAGCRGRAHRWGFCRSALCTCDRGTDSRWQRSTMPIITSRIYILRKPVWISATRASDWPWNIAAAGWARNWLIATASPASIFMSLFRLTRKNSFPSSMSRLRIPGSWPARHSSNGTPIRNIGKS